MYTLRDLIVAGPDARSAVEFSQRGYDYERSSRSASILNIDCELPRHHRATQRRPPPALAYLLRPGRSCGRRRGPRPRHPRPGPIAQELRRAQRHRLNRTWATASTLGFFNVNYHRSDAGRRLPDLSPGQTCAACSRGPSTSTRPPSASPVPLALNLRRIYRHHGGSARRRRRR